MKVAPWFAPMEQKEWIGLKHLRLSIWKANQCIGMVVSVVKIFISGTLQFITRFGKIHATKMISMQHYATDLSDVFIDGWAISTHPKSRLTARCCEAFN